MKSEVENPPAFPNKDELGNMIPGLSLRDYFAAKALPLAMADNDIYGKTVHCANQSKLSIPETLAKMAYDLADAMLLERSKKKEGA
jgi:hypothetical protein